MQGGCFGFHPSTVGGAFPCFFFLNFHPGKYWGKKMNQFLTHIFQKGLVQPPTSEDFHLVSCTKTWVFFRSLEIFR